MISLVESSKNRVGKLALNMEADEIDTGALDEALEALDDAIDIMEDFLDDEET